VRRIIRLLIWAIFFGVIAAAGSYAGARFKAGQVLGRRPPVEGFSWTFAYEGVEGLEGTPRAWVFTYDRVRLPGVSRARIVVSLAGKVLSTTPPDLEQRIERYKASLEP
jgi:hypothetical protein